MKNLILLLALAFSANAYVDKIPSAMRSVTNTVADPVQVLFLNGSFEDTSEIAYSPVFELSHLMVYHGPDSTGTLKDDSAFGQVRLMAYDITDSAAVTDSVNVQVVTQCSDYSACSNPLKCPDLSDPWYTVFTDTVVDVSAASAKVELTRNLSAGAISTCRFMRWKATELSTALQNKPHIIGEWHRKQRGQ
jgi:hypothetical protein